VLGVVSSYAPSLRTSPIPPTQETFEDFKSSYRLAKNSFSLPGLGESGDDCMSLRASDFAVNGEAVRYEHLKCKRVECPNCWADWARRRVFKIALKIWAYAEKNDVKPYLCVASVPEDEARTWNWERLNNSLFRRFYRRGEKVGIEGGCGIFHSFRLLDFAKKRLSDLGYGSGDMDAGYWKGVRENALNLDSWRSYVRFSPHLHAIVFADPEEHRGDDFVIRFKDDDYGNPVKLELDDVIGLLFYLVTHVGVGSEFQTKVTRIFGDVYSFDPKKELSEEEFDELAQEIAEKVDMVWDSEEEELTYEDDSEKDYNWVSVWKLGEYLNGVDYEEWREGVSEAYKEFLDILWSRTWVLRNPPPLEDMLEDHEFYDVEIVSESLPEKEIEELAEAGV